MIQNCRCENRRCQRTVGILCDGNGDCPTNTVTAKWINKPGYPADECASQCTNVPKFKCTDPSYRDTGTGLSFARCDVRVSSIFASKVLTKINLTEIKRLYFTPLNERNKFLFVLTRSFLTNKFILKTSSLFFKNILLYLRIKKYLWGMHF